jgi:hypothetical protein
MVTVKRAKERVTCRVCGRRYYGKVPRGGDGSGIYPEWHYRVIPAITNLGVMNKRGRTEVCPGSYQEAVESPGDL